MSKIKIKSPFAFFIASLFFISACKPKINELTFDDGGLDFSKYVALGTESSAGFMDGALFNEGQENSFPAILAKQFTYVGGGEFKQPLFNSTNGFGYGAASKTKLKNKTFCTGTTSLSAEYVAAQGDAGISNYVGGKSFNNMSVPGMKSYQLQSQDFGNPLILISGSPYYSRFAIQPGQSTVLADAKNQMPTFFSYGVGTNDALAYAITGGDGSETITSESIFKSSTENAIATLAAAQAKGLVLNIPNIADLPFFTTIPYNALVLSQQEADSLNTLYSLLNPSIHFAEGNNAFVMEDVTAPGQKRQIKSTEYVLLSLPFDSVYCGGWGSNTLKPLTDNYVLDAKEMKMVNDSVAKFNTTLKTVAEQYNLVYVDVNAFYKSIKAGIIFNGVTYSPQYISGGLFSLDGINLNAKGNAMVANECIKAINLKYGSRIPLADVNAYRGIVFP